MSFNPDRENGTKINYHEVGKALGKLFHKTFTAYEWTSPNTFRKVEKQTEIEPSLAAHEMIARLINPVVDDQQTFYGVNTRMMSLNQRNEYIKEQAEKLKDKAEEYMEQKKAEYEEAMKAAEEAAQEAQVPAAPIEPKGE